MSLIQIYAYMGLDVRLRRYAYWCLQSKTMLSGETEIPFDHNGRLKGWLFIRSLMQISTYFTSSANILSCLVQKQRGMLSLGRYRRNILYCHVWFETNKDCWLKRCIAEIFSNGLNTRLRNSYEYSRFQPRTYPESQVPIPATLFPVGATYRRFPSRR